MCNPNMINCPTLQDTTYLVLMALEQAYHKQTTFQGFSQIKYPQLTKIYQGAMKDLLEEQPRYYIQ